MPKVSLRKRQLARRDALPPEARRRNDRSIRECVLRMPEYLAARTIALYSPIRSEVDISALISPALASGKRVLFPRVNGAEIDFLAISALGELEPGAFGVAEPRGDKIVPVADIDLLLVPGVAFDRTGHRLGYGKGYYDRVLSLLNGQVAVGVAYDLQLVEALPTERHDQRLNVLVTEEALLRFPD